MPQSTVSVILPTWNRAELLRQAVDSVLGQTWQAWELIVVDDGSTDETASMLAGLGEPRVRVIRRDHSGNPARVRNAGLAHARGDIVAFLDSDDLWEPDKLATQIPGLDHSGCGWSYTAFTRIDAAGRPMGDDGVRPWRPLQGWVLEPLLRIDAVVPTPTVAVRRTLLEAVGGFDEALVQCEEYELWFRLAALSAVHLAARSLARVRVHAVHHQRDREQVHDAWVRVFEKTAGTLRDPRLAALCRARRAEHLVTLAHIRAVSRGERRSPLALLAAAFPWRWSHWSWWRALLRTTLGAQGARLVRFVRRTLSSDA